MRLMSVLACLALSGVAPCLMAAPPPASASHPVAQAVSQKVNLNTATVKAMEALPGMSASKARAIVAWRHHHGPFSSIEDLHKVVGFKRLDGHAWQEMKQNFTVS